MGTRYYDFTSAFDQASAPTGSSPSGTSDFVTVGYGVSNYARYIDTIANLKAVSSSYRADGVAMWVDELLAWFYFDSASSATGDDENTITPSAGTGRWLRMQVKGFGAVQNVATAATIAAMASSTPVVRLTGSTTTNIQGITAGIGEQILSVYNASSAVVTLTHESGSASASNRLSLEQSASINVNPGGSFLLRYDKTLTRWVPASGGSAASSTTSNFPSELYNVGFAASVAANAMTVAFKQADASTDPTSGSPSKIAFRSSTASTGSSVERTITSAITLTVPSGATLGHPSGSAAYVYVYAIDNAGTVELAVSSVLYDERGLQSTSAIGTGSDDNGIYSTTARSNVAIRLLGRITSTQTTAGTWATSPSEIALSSLNAFSEPRVNTEVVSTTQYDQASPSVGTWYAPANAVTLAVNPGTYEITVQGSAYLLHSTANTGALLIGSLSSSTSAGSGLLDNPFFILDNYYPTGAVANIHRATFFQFTTKDLTFTAATNLYVHFKYANTSGTPTVNNMGVQILGSGNGISLRIIAKRVG